MTDAEEFWSDQDMPTPEGAHVVTKDEGMAIVSATFFDEDGYKVADSLDVWPTAWSRKGAIDYLRDHIAEKHPHTLTSFDSAPRIELP